MADSRCKPAECADHGPYIASAVAVFGDVWTSCPRCEAGREERERLESQIEQDRQNKAKWLARLESSGIPKRFYAAELSLYEALGAGQIAALAWATGYASEFEIALQTGRSALLVGKPGTGKTHLAVGICLHVLGRGQEAAFCTVQRMMRRIKATWGRSATETEIQAIAAYTKPDLLVLDEVGIQFGSKAEHDLMFDVLNDRYENMRPTILISNLPLADVKTLLGDRVIDRMREAGGKVVAFDWESHRA
jgi:DNA replication protein DnaC